MPRSPNHIISRHIITPAATGDLATGLREPCNKLNVQFKKRLGTLSTSGLKGHVMENQNKVIEKSMKKLFGKSVPESCEYLILRIRSRNMFTSQTNVRVNQKTIEEVAIFRGNPAFDIPGI